MPTFESQVFDNGASLHFHHFDCFGAEYTLVSWFLWRRTCSLGFSGAEYGHLASLAPNIVLPIRTLELPISIACSKSPDIPILSSKSSGRRFSSRQIESRVSTNRTKSGLGPSVRT